MSPVKSVEQAKGLLPTCMVGGTVTGAAGSAWPDTHVLPKNLTLGIHIYTNYGVLHTTSLAPSPAFMGKKACYRLLAHAPNYWDIFTRKISYNTEFIREKS